MWPVVIALVALVGCGTGGGGNEESSTSATATPNAPAATATPRAIGRAWAAGNALVRSSDGGRSWQTLRPAEGLTGVSFADRLVGWAVGTQTLLRSIDGGDTWTDQTRALPIDIIRSLNAVTAFSATRALIVGGLVPQGGIAMLGQVYLRLTSDAGTTWGPAPFDRGGRPGSSEAELRHVCFTDTGIGLACGRSGSIFSPNNICALSNDNGAHWLHISDRVRANAVACVGDSTLWTLRGLADLRQSTDGGRTWSDRRDTLPTNARIDLDALTFATEAHGWAVGTDDAGQPLILHTSDAGDTWQSQLVPATASGTLKAVRFTDPRNGIAVGQGGGAIGFFTTDGGGEWRVATFPPGTPGLRSLAVVP